MFLLYFTFYIIISSSSLILYLACEHILHILALNLLQVSCDLHAHLLSTQYIPNHLRQTTLEWLLLMISQLLLGHEARAQYKIVSKSELRPQPLSSYFAELHVNILFIIKLKFLCSLNDHIAPPPFPTMLTIKPKMVIIF